jgi:PAS domain S-box-containing protein
MMRRSSTHGMAPRGLPATAQEVDPILAQFLRLSSHLFCVIGIDGCFRMVSQGWTTLGWSSVDLVSRPWLDLVHHDDWAATAGIASRLQTWDSVLDLSNRYRAKDGMYHWLEWRLALSDERDIIYGVAQDVTETKATKQAMHELSESLATTLNSIGDAVIATDTLANVTRMNPVAEQLTGWSLAEARGKPIRDILPLVDHDGQATVESPFDRVLRDGVAMRLPSHTELSRRDGTDIPIGDTCAPIHATDGSVSGAVIVFRDLTPQKTMEMVEAKCRKQLVFADRMAAVGTLAAGVAHEINNPLSFVVANVDLAIEEIRAIVGGSPAGRMKDLEEMLLEARQGSDRVTKIVRSLKTFSRIQTDRPAVIDLLPVIDVSINMVQNEIRHRARLVKDYGKVPLVEADDTRLGQVFINLLVNAAHAFPVGNSDANEVRIATSTDSSGRAVVEVRDTGSGIPPALLGRIFDPFFTTKPIGVGTGLGLAISHNIVTGMGGEITVESELGRGTTFRVVLPASSSLNRTSAAVSRKPMQTSKGMGHAKVLVVDDEPAVGLVIRRILARHEVTVVTTAHDALALLAAGKRFDLILTDLMMPRVSGMELYDELVRLYPEIAARIVFLTGGAFTPEAHAFLDKVRNERMDKPFDAGKLRELTQRFSSAKTSTT